ncbi:Trans-aconitate 2-methyltransferase [compost metagenome]
MAQDSWNPQQYEKFKYERAQPFYDLMNLLEPTPHAQVIDLGCGTGELTAELHRFLDATKTTGMDSSEKMLEKAQAFADKDIHFIKGDIQTWDVSTEYDVIFSNAALQWCTDHPALFNRLRKALRPSGQLAVQMPMNHDYPTHVIAIQMSKEEPWRSLMKGEVYDKWDSLLPPEQYATMLFKMGFKDQKVFMRVYGHQLESRDDVVEWTRGTLLTHFQSRLSATDFENFVAEFRTRLNRQLPDDKPFFYPFKRLLLWARL